MNDLQTCFELEQAKARYCRLMDTKNWAELGGLLAEDLVFDLTDGNPEATPIIGRDAALEAVRLSVGDAKTVHQVHSPEFELGGDTARVIWAVHERVVWNNGSSLTAYGHYHDRWVRSELGWRIAELRLTHLIIDFA
ncbi:nuclear transport factor 2 family protein [Mycolicibacterium sp. 050232]|uniref:nuclear transport factor 2 family protein n=1 Tax=Mycolicibacterium sp. 050232 TaxID=3113982 RepID=UPI002E2E2CB5|nr:nuclear transport factor 2 family protein [Mycolicibacterium sp. 050232]MED5812091.1 nuclear transport factor 2 family protein [Mycolicibacterium sp. 050232]